MDYKIKSWWNNTTCEYSLEDMNWYDKIIKEPERAFPIAVYPLLKKYLIDFRGKRICVPSSGDNSRVRFSFVGRKSDVMRLFRKTNRKCAKSSKKT